MQQNDYEVRPFSTPKEFDVWLQKYHTTARGIWIKMAKKASGIQSVTHDNALEIALCYGWIDGQTKSLDEHFFLQKFTPRKKRSLWSKRNRDIISRLIRENRMQEAGHREIEAAKADGRWERAYDSPKTMVIPDDFLAELAKDKKAEDVFRTLSKTNVYAIVWRLQTAAKPEIRQRRMKQILMMLHDEKKLH